MTCVRKIGETVTKWMNDVLSVDGWLCALLRGMQIDSYTQMRSVVFGRRGGWFRSSTWIAGEEFRLFSLSFSAPPGWLVGPCEHDEHYTYRHSYSSSSSYTYVQLLPHRAFAGELRARIYHWNGWWVEIFRHWMDTFRFTVQDLTGSTAAISNYLINVGSFLCHPPRSQSVRKAHRLATKGRTPNSVLWLLRRNRFGRFYVSYRCLRVDPLCTTSPSSVFRCITHSITIRESFPRHQQQRTI